ncbi:MAG: penicillin-binding protein 2 [Fimbriimonadales bacterium]
MGHTQNTVRTAKLSRQDLARMRVAGGLMLAGGVLLCARLAQLQIVQAKELRHIAERRRLRERPLLAVRGTIYDRNRKPLARSVMNYHVVIDPTSVKNPEAVAHWLAEHLGLNAHQLAREIWQRQAKGSRYLLVKRSAPTHQVEPLLKEYRAMPFRERPVILDTEQVPAREYPHSQMAPQVIGLTSLQGSRDEGFWLAPQGGVESAMDAVLAGENGIVEGEVAPGGLMIPETILQRTLPKDGRAVRLTLDLAIQESAEMALDELCKRHRPKGALAIVMDPHTGDLLAIANRPTTDLATRKGLERSWEPMRNHAVNLLYEPGSTIKPLVVAWALEQGKVRPNERFRCSGSTAIGRLRVGCSAHGGGRKAHGVQSVEEVLVNSCNVATAQMGLRLGLEGVYTVFERFHLLGRVDIPLPGVQAGYAPRPQEIRYGRDIRTANWAFGQGLMITPLALTASYAVLANEGFYRHPCGRDSGYYKKYTKRHKTSWDW